MKRLQTTKQAAEELGCDEKTIRRHCGANPPAPHTRLKNRQIRVDAGELVIWGKANNINFRPGRPTENADSPDLERARLRKENALAAKYELHVAKERRELVPMSEVKDQFMEEVGRAKSRFNALPADTAGACVGLDAGDIQTLLQSRVNLILEDLANGLN